MNGWNRPTVLPRQPSAWEQTRPALTNFLSNLAFMKMQQGFQTKQAAAAATRATEVEKSRRQFESALKGAEYDPEKGTLTFQPIELTEEQKKYFIAIQPPGGPPILKEKPAPIKPTFFTGAKGEVTPVYTGREGITVGKPLGILGQPAPVQPLETLVMPDGTEKTFRRGAPALDVAIKAGGIRRAAAQPRGLLTEGSVLQNIRELADFDQTKTAKWYKRYRELFVQFKNNREMAFNQTMQEMGGKAKPDLAPKQDYGYLWQ